jgi:SanA protein
MSKTLHNLSKVMASIQSSGWQWGKIGGFPAGLRMDSIWRCRRPVGKLRPIAHCVYCGVNSLLKHFFKMVAMLLRVTVILLLLVVAIIIGLRAVVALVYRGGTYTVDTVPAHRVAIIFGARVYPDERPSAMLADRVAAGVDLYRAGKVEVLLMTGDNSYLDYNEPDAMKTYAMELGVPEEDIVVDYAGRRTYDSCYRARHIFQVDEAILVTQNFHLDRALLLCNALGVQSVGVWADYQRPHGYSRVSLTYSRLREFPAMLAAVIDLVRRPVPILGDPLPIFPRG